MTVQGSAQVLSTQSIQLCPNLQNIQVEYCLKSREINSIAAFNHNENENNDIIEIEENKEVIQKIFKMMENFTKEIIKLKEMNNLQ